MARFSAPDHTGPGAHRAYCTMDTGFFPEVMRPGRGVNHPPSSSAEVKETEELYLYSPSRPSCPVLGWLCFMIFSFIVFHEEDKLCFLPGANGGWWTTKDRCINTVNYLLISDISTSSRHRLWSIIHLFLNTKKCYKYDILQSTSVLLFSKLFTN